MIRYENGLFTLETENTMYMFEVIPSGHLKHLYYGKRINVERDARYVLAPQLKYQPGNVITYSDEYPLLSLETIPLEVSSLGKGDVREAFVVIKNIDGSYTSDFVYDRHEICDGHEGLCGLPSAYGNQDACMQVKLWLKSKQNNVIILLVYTVFEETNCITRSCKVINRESSDISVERIMSTQLDLADSRYDFVHFNGAWLREMQKNVSRCHYGKLVNDTICGISSNRSNPFVMLTRPDITEQSGEGYAFNLIYSGNHYECAHTDSFGRLRFVSGIQPSGFNFTLKPGEEFQAPEAVMTYSFQGLSGISKNMHAFVRNHIVRGEWSKKERPVVFNSWEACYFKFDESMLTKLAKKASLLGMEVFVIDDGWFGKRDNDKSSLGDWTCNTSKLPSGLDGFSNKLASMGLKMGIWVEPEMVNVDSECARQHPDWCVEIPGKDHSEGRNQRILDLTRKDVRNYIIEAMSRIFEVNNLAYVKWDMNRIFSDCYSQALERQSEFSHRYILGLYEVLNVLKERFPHILFEGCASGGNRFDLGMLCYFDQIWASDNTDAWCRCQIQKGYSYGYPMSVISCHVSGSPNHQTLRRMSLESRFNAALIGQLGYESNINDISQEEQKQIKNQILIYKQNRKWLFNSDFYRIEEGNVNNNEENQYTFICVSKDRTKAIGFVMQGIVTPNMPYANFKSVGLDENVMYRFYNRRLQYNIKDFGDLVNAVSPVHIKQDSLMHNIASKFIKMDGETEEYIVSGGLLNNAGINLKQNYCATGFDKDVRYYQDFSSRIYFIEEYKNEDDEKG